MDVLFPVTFEEKFCLTCKQAKKVDEFHRNKRYPDGRCYECAVCHTERTKKWNKAHYDSDKARAKHLKATYGITEAQYLELYEKQGGVCACCGKKETVFSNKKKDTFQLAIDHDHETGKVRALLCIACNTSLGAMNEDPERIEALLRYARNLKS